MQKGLPLKKSQIIRTKAAASSGSPALLKFSVHGVLAVPYDTAPYHEGQGPAHRQRIPYGMWDMGIWYSGLRDRHGSMLSTKHAGHTYTNPTLRARHAVGRHTQAINSQGILLKRHTICCAFVCTDDTGLILDQGNIPYQTPKPQPKTKTVQLTERSALQKAGKQHAVAACSE